MHAYTYCLCPLAFISNCYGYNYHILNYLLTLSFSNTLFFVMKLFNLFKKKDIIIDIDSTPQDIVDDVIEENEIEQTIETLDKKVIDFYISYFANEDLSNEIFNDPFYGDYILHSPSSDDLDVLFEEAARLIVVHQQGSTSLIQRKFSIGYNRSGRIMNQLEVTGIVGTIKGSFPREVLIKDQNTLEKHLEAISNGKCSTSIPYGLNEDLKAEIRIKYEESIDSMKNDKKKEFYHLKELREQEEIKRQKDIIRQELIEKERMRVLRREVRQELIDNEMFTQNRGREYIPQDIQDKVWVRDGGKCVKCGSQEKLEFDHMIPVSKGGSSTYRNIQLLCEKCNRQKSNNIG